MLDDITFGWWWTGTNSQSSTSKALTWIQCKLGKQYLVKKFTLPWESNPGPTPIRGDTATLIASVGLKKTTFHCLTQLFSVLFSKKTRCLIAGWVSIWRREVVQSTLPYSLSLAFHDHALQVRSSRRVTLLVIGFHCQKFPETRGLDCFYLLCIATDAWTSGMFSWTVSTEP